MGLFNFFKKNSSDNNQSNRQEEIPTDQNGYLLDTLKSRLIESGYQVDKHGQYASLIVNSDIEIATVIIENPDYHPAILHLMIVTINKSYFPKGIIENIVGVGATLSEKVNSVIDNYFDTTFSPIVESFSDTHNPDLDFTEVIDGREVLYHPILGNIFTQGNWNELPQNELFFEMIKGMLRGNLTADKFNWLKLYISKRADGGIIGECLLNNEPWEEGLSLISEYAESWKITGDFSGLKQFIMFRRCDSFD